MKWLPTVFLIASAFAEPPVYLPPHSADPSLHNNAYSQVQLNPQYVEQQYARPQAAYEKNARILKHDSELSAHGYQYAYETENGIRAQEIGETGHGTRAQGSYSYTGDDGQVYSISYTADENGFHAQGAHLPTPPPTPEAILKALEQNARDEAAGISDDGSYNDGHSQQYSQGAQYQQYAVPAPISEYSQPQHSQERQHYSQDAQPAQAQGQAEGYNY